MRIIRRISAVLVGIVFFISGVLKLMDPVGAKLVVDGYLNFLHLGFLRFADSAIGVGAALTESLCGAALLTGVWKKATGILVGVMMAFFTVLTVLLVAFDPSMDCGCFGEAVHLTHTQSLLKNIVLLLLWALAFIPLRSQEQTRKIKYGTFATVAVALLLFLFYSAMSIPMVDFTKYKPGAELMLSDEIEADDTSTPTLSFSSADGNYADSLALSGNVLVISVYNPERVSDRRWDRIGATVAAAEQTGYTPLLLACSNPEDIMETVSSQDILSVTYFSDLKELIALNRSNGGATYISDGQIVAKWSAGTLPGREKLSTMAARNSAEVLVSENNVPGLKFQALVLFMLAVMMLL